MATQATLINSAGQKVVVDSGSQQAQQYFSQGYQLMGPSGTYAAPKTTQPPTSTALPAGMTQLTSPTQLSQYNVVGQVGTTGTPGSYLYGTPKTIAADTIGTGSSTNVGSPAPNPAPADSTAAGSTAFQAGVQAKIDAANAIEQANKTPESTAADALTAQISSLYSQTAGRAQETATQEANRNIPGMNTELSNINSSIQTGLAEYNQLKASYAMTSQANRSQIVPMSKIIGNEAQIQYAQQVALNGKAADIALLQAQALGLQGNIAEAEKQAQKAVDLKYAPIEEQIAIKTSQLALLEGTLNKQEQTKADALKAQYAEQSTAVATAKQRELDFQNVLLTASVAGAPMTLINQAKATNDPIQAASILSSFLKATSSTAQPTASIQEYQFAVSQGYKGTYTQYQNEDANRKRSVSTTNNVTYGTKLEDQQIADFNKAAGDYVLKLASNAITWGAAWNAMRAQFPQASNDRIDASLNKATYYPK